jgi:DNA oxidative demethylase
MATTIAIPASRLATAASGATAGIADPGEDGVEKSPDNPHMLAMTARARANLQRSVQPDLFAGEIVPGLAYAPDLMTAAEEAELIERLDDVSLAPFRFQNWLGKRETASFGWRYDFTDASFAPAAPIPEFLLPLRERLARFAERAPGEFVQALVVRYDPGAGIGWHRDRPVFEHVAAVSLGAFAALRLRRRMAGGFERAVLPLEPRSAYHLSGEARHEWEHSILPLPERRWSVSFRSLAGPSGKRGLPEDPR